MAKPSKSRMDRGHVGERRYGKAPLVPCSWLRPRSSLRPGEVAISTFALSFRKKSERSHDHVEEEVHRTFLGHDDSSRGRHRMYDGTEPQLRKLELLADRERSSPSGGFYPVFSGSSKTHSPTSF